MDLDMVGMVVVDVESISVVVVGVMVGLDEEAVENQELVWTVIVDVSFSVVGSMVEGEEEAVMDVDVVGMVVVNVETVSVVVVEVDKRV